MRVGKDHPLAGQLVGTGGRDLAMLRIQAVHVPVAQIVAHDEDDIGLLDSACRAARQDHTQQQSLEQIENTVFHVAQF